MNPKEKQIYEDALKEKKELKQAKTVFIVGSGPSLKDFDFKQLTNKYTVALNDVIYYLPNPDGFVFYDRRWWERNYIRLDHRFTQLKPIPWAATFDRTPRHYPINYAIFYFKIGGTEGIDTRPEFVKTGNNVCHLAINISLKIPFIERIVLIGIDMTYKKDRYFYGDDKSHDVHEFTRQLPYFERIWRELPEGIEIINANPGSAIDCFKKMDREKAIEIY